ncbi:hypothetical protein BC477_02865 [Clavibacter michiganensis subsp. michiganensis]|uniref:Uncharacterized protein n=1 Tax=Clavibacter michiganensis subsp. michiganensis TaxID=33013 RepID=A0A251XKD8_CLAMM|nr:hypothetical protein BC477_02865 [Clavibacter michiganensis subsp. michiganensis]OUE03653.1 hypothetical protein CMMCAS07_01800 [Clavibacter michiganensis subsp. michiganensis]
MRAADPRRRRPRSRPDSLAGTLVVQAAASLTGSMDEVARDFESVHPA